LGIKITKFINEVIDIYEQDLEIDKCCICGRETKIIHIKYGFDGFCRKIWIPKQYCKNCYNLKYCNIKTALEKEAVNKD